MDADPDPKDGPGRRGAPGRKARRHGGHGHGHGHGGETAWERERSQRAKARLARWDRRTAIPLVVAAGLYLGAYAAHVLAQNMAARWHDLCVTVTYVTWGLFAVDYVVRWRLGPHRHLLVYIRHHLLDTAVLVLPLLRPLRFVPAYQAMRRRGGEPRLGLYARVIAYSGMSAVLLGFAGSLAVFQQERHAPGSNIHTFGDSVWWACATLTTVGYGDATPVTPVGRTIAAVMMVMGLALLGAVTGSFSSWLIQSFSADEQKAAEAGASAGGAGKPSGGRGRNRNRRRRPGFRHGRRHVRRHVRRRSGDTSGRGMSGDGGA